jgi:hypothetical protein
MALPRRAKDFRICTFAIDKPQTNKADAAGVNSLLDTFHILHGCILYTKAHKLPLLVNRCEIDATCQLFFCGQDASLCAKGKQRLCAAQEGS